MLDEGEMTRILSGLVSNRALDTLGRRFGKETFTRLIPASIGEQNTYGERITGGAFEAFIGALYCEVGLDDVAFFVNAIMEEPLSNSYTRPEFDRHPAGAFPEKGRGSSGIPGNGKGRP